MTRTWWSLGSHRKRRCTDVLYIPFFTLLVDDRHVVSCHEARCSRPGLLGKRPVHGHRDVACRPALRNLERSDAAKADRTAKSADRGPRREVPGKCRLVTAGERLEEARKLARKRALRGLVRTRLRRAGKRGHGRGGKPSRLGRPPEPAPRGAGRRAGIPAPP